MLSLELCTVIMVNILMGIKMITMGKWLKKMTDIAWAFINAYFYWLRNPFNYSVLSKSTVYLRGEEDAIFEEIDFVGVVQDIPDVTDHSIIHKWVVVKTFYGEWKDDNNSNA